MCTENEIKIVMKNVKSDGTPIAVQPVPEPQVVYENFSLKDIETKKNDSDD